ncbi:hypothetical protein NPS01_25100 [Nocardioides psychrotolerans]|uniref:Uncharacterized protein n=1 Tax=Nocardioides psychrotolerans TaxID=1005945 RepID=A0A1I3LKV0_9ACTN|nr:hypothetical protein [Nocardioides psychrotolerans]GEP38847.1 hypothetical protein NPS01_25100 [Nocardioides psychrotolerans]SFI85317.1 hypothetical protein SAMN05216561_11412 [Nocardioides psychrotolerans]
MSTATVTLQAPTALLALVQHIHDHGLGAPLTIHSPSTASPCFTVSVVAASYDAWVASGFTATDTTSHPVGQRISGKRWEQVATTGLLQPYGIRLVLKFTRPRPTGRPLVAVTTGCTA